jgi:DNA polymerase-3 subunit alpha
MKFANLHGHSHYSLLHAFGSPAAIVKRAKELNYDAVALTDNGVLYGAIEFYKAAKKEGIKAIIGCDLYVAPRSRLKKETKGDGRPYRLPVLAENQAGYNNLVKIVTDAQIQGFYYKPRTDIEMLKENSEGLIALSGGLYGQLARLILAEDEEGIKEYLKVQLDIFGKDNFFLEIQDNPLSTNQNLINEKVKQIAKDHGLGLVLTLNSFYPREEDKDLQDIMLSVYSGTTLEMENRPKLYGDHHLKPVEEFSERYKDIPEAIENTVKIAERCNLDFQFGVNLIPEFKTPKDVPAHKYLRTLCEEGLNKHMKGKVPKEYKERLDYELNLVHKMGFDTYFLIVWDFVKYAKDQGILVGPGRGSAAGAIIAWCLGITELDPIKYGLFFERFLNPERVSMPDIDIDFADNRRGEVLEYVVNKYGKNNFAQIITFGTLAPKAAIRDTGRVLGYSYDEVDKIAKTVPPAILGKYAPLKVSIEEDPALSDLYKNDVRAKRVLDYAKKLEGSVRQIGTHACAVVISEKPLTEYTALQPATGNKEEIVTQYSAKPLEELGLLKMDFLGLRNLTVIQNALEMIKKTHKKEIDLNELPLDDKKTFALLQKGDTTGVFQLESGGMRRYLKDLKPTKFGDIVAMGALYRPGPMKYIPTYINGKHDPDSVAYIHESFKEILEETYGVAVYQEQILQIARDFAGFTLGEADILRKAVGKKDPKLLAEQREKFIKGAIEQGYKKDFCVKVFEEVVEPFAGYGFNKAHAACYGMIAYQTAYLKAHYPVEFMTALLMSDAENMDRVALEIQECNEMNIDVLPPNVNHSDLNFSITSLKGIRFGLLAIKGVGEGPVNAIIEARAEGKFTSLADFAKRVPSSVLNKKTIQALALSGALDSLGDRKQIAENFSEISQFAKGTQQNANSSQTDIFSMLDSSEEENSLHIREVEPLNMIEKLRYEKELLGIYLSGHPLKGLSGYISRKANLIGNLSPRKVDKKIKIIGLVSELRRIKTKREDYMCTFVAEDPSAKIRVVVFPRTYTKFQDLIEDDKVLSLSGKLDNKRGNYQIIVDEIKSRSLTSMIENAKSDRSFEEKAKAGLTIRFIDDILEDEEQKEEIYQIKIKAKTPKEAMNSLKNLLIENKGNTTTEIFLEKSDKVIRLPFGVKVTKELEKKVAAIIE